MMDSITIENFRCFRERQTVPLAPLTLLVGENSTGKTSFLALIRALVEYVADNRQPDFKKPPFDLGSFDEIVYVGSGGQRPDQFKAGFTGDSNVFINEGRPQPVRVDLTFGRRGTAPAVVRRQVEISDVWIVHELVETGEYLLQIGKGDSVWQLDVDLPSYLPEVDLEAYRAFIRSGALLSEAENMSLRRISGSDTFSDADSFFLSAIEQFPVWHGDNQVVASAPVRSKPKRTYDPDPEDRSAEGGSVPTYMADLSARHPQDWAVLKEQLEAFGRPARLFDAIDVRQFGTSPGDPFQIQISPDSGESLNVRRNLADVGYGISQALPIAVQLLRPGTEGKFLLQEPEIHLHPTAQAEFGSLFCQVAATDRQLIVETHSDHLIDRVRMDVRDGKTDLGVDDVRILYFERSGLDVKIHELWWDENGNLENAPQSYRQFFMQEVERSLWPPE